MVRKLAAACFLFAANLCLAQPYVGVNLEGSNYYCSEISFVDVFKHSQPFYAQKIGAKFQQSDPNGVRFRADGYPSHIAKDHTADSLWKIPVGYPRDDHVILWDGSGNVVPMLASGHEIVSQRPGRLQYRLPADMTKRFNRGVRILKTDPADPVRNIRVVPLRYENQYLASEPVNPFRKEFLDRWQKMQTFRYMDWNATNNSSVATWDQRPRTTDQSQGAKGIAYEYQIAHANLTNTHPWFTIPHQADDRCVRKIALLIRDSLKPNLVARIEYSNEVWNSIFTQSAYAREKATQLDGEKSNFRGQIRWYSKRSVEIFDIFQEVFTHNGTEPEGMNRLIRVLSAQASNPWVASQVLAYREAYQKTDALAIAPYFGRNLDSGNEAVAWKKAGWPARWQIVESDLHDAMNYMTAHKELLAQTTDRRGQSIYAHIKLFAYEGGQHYVGHPSTFQDDELTEALNALNRRKEMKAFYCRYLDHWREIGGHDFLLFASLGEYSKFGSWGLMEHEGQSLRETPKLSGVLTHID